MTTETVSRDHLSPLCWCDHRPCLGMAPPELASCRAECSSAPNPYRAGNPTRQMGQGQSEAPLADTLVQRQSTCRETSDGKYWQTNTGGRWANLEHPRTESHGHTHAAATGLSPTAVATCLHPEKQWQTAPPRYSDDAGSSHASTVPGFPLILLRRQLLTRIPMDFGQHAPRQMPSKHASLPYVGMIVRNGYSKAISAPASTGFRMHGS